MKNLIILLTSYFILFNASVSSQNLISNGSFENGTTGYPTGRHQTIGITNATDDIGPDDWKSQYSIDNGNHMHSPDWFSDNSYPLPDIISSGAQDGSFYLGMGDYELIQQQCAIGEGQVYFFSLYYQLSDDISGGNFDSHLKIILSETQPEYESNSSNDLCESDYKTLKHTGVKQTILDLPLDVTNYPIGSEWHKIAYLFRADDDYSWLTIEVVNGMSTSFCERSYVGIDNVKVEGICSLPCLPAEANSPIHYSSWRANISADVLANAAITGQHDNILILPDGTIYVESPWHAYIQNALGFDFTVIDRWGAGHIVAGKYYFYDTETLNDPVDGYYTLLWGGDNTITYNTLPPGTYDYFLDIWNCHEYISVQGYINLFYFEDVDQDHALENNIHYDLQLPPACCSGHKFIRNKTYNSTEEIHTNDFIEAGYNSFDYYEWCCGSSPGPVVVQNGGNITYYSENSINLMDGFSAESGSTFETKIESCGNRNVRVGRDRFNSKYANLKDPTMSIGQSHPFLYPNPTHGETIIFNPNSNKWSYKIFNASGQAVKHSNVTGNREKIDLTNEANGFYFIQIIGDSDVQILKIAKVM